MIYKSLIQDFFYEDSGSTALSYYLTCSGETIYTGKAYNPKGIKINIRKLVEDWLWNAMPDFRGYNGVMVEHPEACRVFSLYTDEGTLLEEYMVFLTYEDLDMPMFTYRGVNGNSDPRQKIFFCGLSDTAFSLTFDVSELYFHIDNTTVGATGGTVHVGYSTEYKNGAYYFTISSGATISSIHKGYLEVVVPENYGTERTFTIEAHNALNDELITSATITQAMANAYFIIDGDFTMFGWDNLLTVTGSTNLNDYTISLTSDWLSVSSNTVSLPTATIVFHAELGDINLDRTETVEIYYMGQLLASFTVTQKALDSGGAILGISNVPTSYYLKSADRDGVTPDYTGVTFYSRTFTAPAAYNASSGYVETDNGIVSHIGALGSESLSAVTNSRGYVDYTNGNLLYLNYHGGYYHTVVYPKGLTAISSGFTYGNYASVITFPVTHHFPEFDTYGARLKGNSWALENIYWNSIIKIPDWEVIDGVGRGFFESIPFVSGDEGGNKYNPVEHFYSNALQIGVHAFTNCDKLKEYTYSSNNTLPSSIGYEAFSGCTSLEYVNALENASGITFGHHAFTLCGTGTTNGLNTGNIVGGTFDNYVFSYAKLSSSVTVTDAVLSAHTFDHTTGVKEVTLSGIDTLHGALFWNSTVQSATTDATYFLSDALGNHPWGRGPFAFCGELKYVDAPNLVSCSFGFNGCSGLTSVNVPSLEILTGVSFNNHYPSDAWEFGYDYGAFGDCQSLQSLYLPSIKKIGLCSFRHCTSLSSLTLGSGLTEIDAYAFKDCTLLTEINFEGTMAQWNSVSFPEEPWMSGLHPAMMNWRSDSNVSTIHCSDGDIAY